MCLLSLNGRRKISWRLGVSLWDLGLFTVICSCCPSMFGVGHGRCFRASCDRFEICFEWNRGKLKLGWKWLFGCLLGWGCCIGQCFLRWLDCLRLCWGWMLVFSCWKGDNRSLTQVRLIQLFLVMQCISSYPSVDHDFVLSASQFSSLKVKPICPS